MNKVFNCGNHILVGLGGTGGKILRAFKMRMFEEFPTAEERKKQPIALLYVDSTREMMPENGRARADFRVMGQDASFTEEEFLNIKSTDISYVLEHINNYPNIKGIVQNVNAVKQAIGSLGEAAGQMRRAGRLLFALNAIGYRSSLESAYTRCRTVSGEENPTTIHIFAGLSGGTGSGSIIDATIIARKLYPNAKILVYAMIPEMSLPKQNMDQGRYYQNGYAAMNELNALQTGRWTPQDVLDGGNVDVFSEGIHGVANSITVYSNVNENGVVINSLEELPKTVSDFLFARIFLIDKSDLQSNGGILRSFSCENMDKFSYEYDELANVGVFEERPVARTKKLNSFGFKRVMYPELRILKHITYTVGESILYQFKYNNWRENIGFVDEERNKDYRKEYLNKENLAKWMLDDLHLTLELKVLESDADYPGFNDYWHDKAIGYAEDAKKADCPLNELDTIMSEFYNKHFREEGVEGFYQGKERVIPEIAREIRHTIENELFEKWKIGDVSIVELQKVSKLLLERLGEMREELEAKAKEEKINYDACEEDRKANVEEWSRLGILQRMVGIGARRYADHQGILTDYYTSKTMLVAWEFAKKLAAKVFVEIGKMDEDILAFAQKINEAIDETERLVAAQRKVNKGLEDVKGAIIEVSEEEEMQAFEADLKCDKIDMPNIARQLREAILPIGDFISFGNLTNNISIDDIKDAFDIKLSDVIRAKHDEKADSDNKVLGLNVLTQLQQQLKTDDDIKEFAHKIISQSGAYLNLNHNQIMLHVRNNEEDLSPNEPASLNHKEILVSMPECDNEGSKRFADKLESAFTGAVRSGERINVKVNRKSPRKDELSVITVSYCFPMRAIDWLSTYKKRYEKSMNSGNVATDMSNAILLHSEGDGSQLPSLFVVENAEEIAKQNAQQAQPAGAPMQQSANGMATPPPMPGGAPLPPPISSPIPEIKLFIAVGGQQYGPYNMEQCKQMVQGGQLTAQSTVWMEGMPGWAAAAQVPALQALFAPPAVAPGMPPLPPTGGPTPPPMV